MKTKYPIHTIMFGLVNSDGVFITWLQTHHGGLHQVPGKRSASLDRESGCGKTQNLATRLCHASIIGEPSFGCNKISVTASPPNIWLLNSPDYLEIFWSLAQPHPTKMAGSVEYTTVSLQKGYPLPASVLDMTLNKLIVRFQ